MQSNPRRCIRRGSIQNPLQRSRLGRRLNHTQQWVYKVETGERRLDVIEFVEIARAIGFDPGEFINTFMDEPADLNAVQRCDSPHPAPSTKNRT